MSFGYETDGGARCQSCDLGSLQLCEVSETEGLNELVLLKHLLLLLLPLHIFLRATPENEDVCFFSFCLF